jgi:hypothetical protein
MGANPTYAFHVIGSSEFPIDMLRYDSCYPADTESALAIQRSLNAETGFTEPCSAKLIGQMRFGPTVKRWESFGYRVVDSEVVR